MMDMRHLAALLIVALVSACGDMQVGGGPSPDSLTGEMLQPDPTAGGEIDDAVGTQIP